MTLPLRLAVLVSGEGTTLEGLAEAFERTGAPAKIVLVISDRTTAPAIGRAERRGLPVRVLAKAGVDGAEWAGGAVEALHEARVDLVVLAGFLHVLPPEFLAAFRGRVVNVHPSLLPRHGGRGMFGLRVHEAVLRSGDVETGATVHLVTEALDAGPVLAQSRLTVGATTSAAELRGRLRPVEIRTLVDVIDRIADGSLSLPLNERA